MNYKEAKSKYLQTVQEKLPKLTTKHDIAAIIDILESQPDSSESEDYKVIKRYGKKILLTKNDDLEVVSIADAFDLILKHHFLTHHGGKLVTLCSISKKYQVVVDCIDIVISLCYVCQKKNTSDRLPRMLTPLPNLVWRINFINMNFGASEEFHCALIMVEDKTNFTILRPLLMDFLETSVELIKIFTTYGRPKKIYVRDTTIKRRLILAFDRMRDLKENWEAPVEVSTNKIFYTEGLHIQKKITEWVEANKSMKWDVGLYFVQHVINNSERQIVSEHHHGCCGVPFELMFGPEAKINPTYKIDPNYVKDLS